MNFEVHDVQISTFSYTFWWNFIWVWGIFWRRRMWGRKAALYSNIPKIMVQTNAQLARL